VSSSVRFPKPLNVASVLLALSLGSLMKTQSADRPPALAGVKIYSAPADEGVLDLDALVSLADNIAGRTICALGDAAALPVKSFIGHFRTEFEQHIRTRKCPVD